MTTWQSRLVYFGVTKTGVEGKDQDNAAADAERETQVRFG